jgi:2-keto-4-pentenoate hydratase/2-oxohepta-3-ene-1,7-dioic acid hydratase in catechol pathway
VPKGQYPDLQNINFSLNVNGETRQTGNTSFMLFNFDYIVAYLSNFFTLKKGDIIFTGTPAGVSAVKIGDQLEGFLEGTSFFKCEVK